MNPKQTVILTMRFQNGEIRTKKIRSRNYTKNVEFKYYYNFMIQLGIQSINVKKL